MTNLLSVRLQPVQAARLKAAAAAQGKRPSEVIRDLVDSLPAVGAEWDWDAHLKRLRRSKPLAAAGMDPQRGAEL